MNNKGFTVIEIVVVVAIIAIFSIILISNFPQFKLQLSLSQTAYKFAQDVRRVQDMSLSNPQYKDSSGVLHAVAGYGVYVDSSTSNNTKYVLYADAMPGNQHYDSLDYIVETIDLGATQPGIIVKEIDGAASTNTTVNFSGPNPATIITPAPTQGAISIVFAQASDLTKTKTVSINTNGLVSVAPINSISAISCNTNSDCGTDGLTGSPFCQTGNVYQNYVTHTCNNPGLPTSSCSNATAAQLQKTCTVSQNCLNGACGNVACNTDTDCGATTTTGNTCATVDPYTNQNVYQFKNTYTCVNPGTANSSCFNNPRAPILQQQCSYWSLSKKVFVLMSAASDGLHMMGVDAGGQLYLSFDSGNSWAVTHPGGQAGLDWSALALSADGSHLIAGVRGNGSPLYVSSTGGTAWTKIQPTGNWASVAISSDGSHLIAGTAVLIDTVNGLVYDAGHLFISSNSGLTWNEIRPGGVLGTWQTLTSSTNGLHLAAAQGSSLYTSSDSGVTWVKGQTKSWNKIAATPDSSHLIGGTGSGLYLSSDYGISWSIVQPSGAGINDNWGLVGISQDGVHLVATNILDNKMYKYDGTYWTSDYPPENLDDHGYRVASSADGSNLIMGGRQLYISSNTGINWTETHPAGNVQAIWQAVASSADGSHLIVGNSANLYTSSNGGTSWTSTQPAGNVQENWQAVASSADASHLIAGWGNNGANGKLYISSNSGVAWTETQPAGNTQQNWQAVASSADGSHMVAAYNSTDASTFGPTKGRLYVSSNYGVSWTEARAVNGDNSWDSVASSADGSHLIASANYGGLYISSNYGANWTEVLSSIKNITPWSSVASSADGSHLVAVGYDVGNSLRQVYSSSDSGASWTQIYPEVSGGGSSIVGYWNSVASSADGSHLILGQVYGRLYLSSDSGQSWSPTWPPTNAYYYNLKNWTFLVSNSDNSYIIAGSNPNHTYIYSQNPIDCSNGVCKGISY